ncbi:30S ribosome-binding factor RbfA [Helicobacter sp. 11S02629-2]|uniref:30S ribosome-binding factor RbfA n=1 Tax=Helicobacter sp. 11S02629-2 TaxID=1476195 RepID=UPI000BA533FF|nr:30S ribosome-binding factor RbfA [Helicobacter sp. 11S02629-2]PAF45325.1 ribosome-binding factor A [Helicobacter sp. 11S02629-2]
MQKNEIIKQKQEAFLQESLSLALASLSDIRINSLTITKVEVSRGKQDVKIYLDKLGIDNEREVLDALKRARNILKEYILNVTGWYAPPKLNFIIDDGLEAQNRLDEIFKQIHKDEKKD